MTKVVVKKLAREPKRQGAVTKKLIRSADGQRTAVYTVDSTSSSFAGDLVRVFESNVAEARKANTAIFGSPDGPRES